MSFPSSPTNGQQVTINGVVYTYNSTTTTWNRSLAAGTTNGSFNTLTANTLTVNGSSVVSSSSGTGNLTLSGSTIALTATGPGATTTGSATAIPVITTDAYGRISAITTASPSLTLNLSGTSGTGTVAANGGTLTFASSNGITASASGSTITISSPQDLRTTATPTFANLTSTGSALIHGFDFRQERANNLKLTAATTGAIGISGYDSGGTWKYQLYSDGSSYGFLNGNWAGWDLQKTIGGQMSLTVSGTQYAVLHAGNYNSYSPTLSGTGATGTWSINVTGSAATATSATSCTSATYAGYLSNSYAYTNGSDGWFRSTGAAGWYNATYSVGMYSAGAGLVQTYNGASLQVNGALYATSSITAYYSDERLKTKVGKIENALDKVEQLSGFLYVENDLAKSLGFKNDQVQVALSAQAVQRVQPEAVALAPFDRDGDGNSKSGENYLTVQYEKLVPLLVEAIKELRGELNSIKDQLRG